MVSEHLSICGNAFISYLGVLFIEASARTGVNVDAAFDQAARDILRKIQQGVFDKGTVSPAMPLIENPQLNTPTVSRR